MLDPKSVVEVGRTMSTIEFTAEEKKLLVQRIQLYFREELDQDIAQFPAMFLLDFFAEEIGPCFYNRALLDAQAVLEERMDGFREALEAIEKPVDLGR